ncbi:S8 family serine peptidase [Bradyrhizobium diazoefficiens]|nr:S8 family serine peptidase [Bradyrhizobium diazoefficiens]MBR0775150.1 S8 family serine peptidase [Bradyrhizobium diazoefficiens]
MKAVWKQARVERQNPYLDWEWRTRPPRTVGASEDWCPVQIQLRAGTDGSYVPNLKRLAATVFAGRQEEDEPGALTIRMSGDEQQALDKLIDDIERHAVTPPTDPVEVQFFVYRPESLANRSSGEAANSFYDIVDIGPPIVGLTFNRTSGAPDPTSFDHSLAALFGHVAIGIIDDGIAFAHERFRSRNGKSRIKALWLQDVERPTRDLGVAFGRRLDNNEINALLRSSKSDAEVYRRAGLLDFAAAGHKSLASRNSHGTHILDLAGGYDPSPGKDHVKDRRPLLAVQLPSPVTGDTSGVTMGSYVLQAVRQIMLWADRISSRLPLVINFSYGILAGPKNGTHRLERALSQLIESRNRRGAPTYLVLPAGNSYRARVTGVMELESHTSDGLDWIILPDDGTPNHLEIWLDGDTIERDLSSIEVNLVPPLGQATAINGLGDGEMGTLEVEGRPIAGVYYDVMRSPGVSQRGRIHISVNGTSPRIAGPRPAPAGRWRLSVTNKSPNRIAARLYIQRDDTPAGFPLRGRQSHFDHAEAYSRVDLDGSYLQPRTRKACPITSEDTLSAIATGSGSIVVGAADASDGLRPADYTSSGPSISRNGPDCAAISDHGAAHWGVLAAGTYSGSVVAMHGTSVAAPQLVRRIADYLESQDPGPVLERVMATDAGAATAAPAGGLPGGIGNAAIADPLADPRRLGAFVLPEAAAAHIPKRKY